MKSEMELMNMDEKQRLAWFMANRGTVIAVGAVWFGLIGWELTHGRVPTFLLFMVPIFALLHIGLYFFYNSRPFVGVDSASDSRFVRYGKIAATLLLAGAVLLPIYSIAGSLGEEPRNRYIWGLVKDDVISLFPLALAYLWPFLVLGLARLQSRRLLQILVHFAVVPVLAVLSCIIVLWIPQLIFEARSFFFILIFPDPNPEWGCYLAVVANGLYLVSWFAGLLRPWGIQEG